MAAVCKVGKMVMVLVEKFRNMTVNGKVWLRERERGRENSGMEGGTKV